MNMIAWSVGAVELPVYVAVPNGIVSGAHQPHALRQYHTHATHKTRKSGREALAMGT